MLYCKIMNSKNVIKNVIISLYFKKMWVCTIIISTLNNMSYEWIGANVIINEIKLRDNTSRGKEIIRLKILYLCNVYSSSLTQEKKGKMMISTNNAVPMPITIISERMIILYIKLLNIRLINNEITVQIIKIPRSYGANLLFCLWLFKIRLFNLRLFKFYRTWR